MKNWTFIHKEGTSMVIVHGNDEVEANIELTQVVKDRKDFELAENIKVGNTEEIPKERQMRLIVKETVE